MIYVDNAQIPYGRMKMCHLFGDSTEELLAMAKTIGLPKTATLQNPGQPNEHIDLSMTYRDKAIKAGAVEVSSRELVKLIRMRRTALEKSAEPVPEPEPEPQEREAFGGVRIVTKPLSPDLEAPIDSQSEGEADLDDGADYEEDEGME